MYDSRKRCRVRISEFEWDEGNALHLELGHGITTEEAEEIFLNQPLCRKTRKGHYAAFGFTEAGRYLVVVFEIKPKNVVRIITGWDMKPAEIRYFKRTRR
jgi:hypothetical protein